jgi:hypothetical protein
MTTTLITAAARDPERGQRAADALGGRFVQLDVTNDASIAAAADTVAAAGSLDVLINNTADPGYTATDLNSHSGPQTVTERTDAAAERPPAAASGRPARSSTGPVSPPSDDILTITVDRELGGDTSCDRRWAPIGEY